MWKEKEKYINIGDILSPVNYMLRVSSDNSGEKFMLLGFL
jgi:hypothetical protein